GRHRQADEAAAVTRHEVDRFRRHLLGGDGQVALVLAIGIVHDDDHSSVADGLDGVLDPRERRIGRRRDSKRGDAWPDARLKPSRSFGARALGAFARPRLLRLCFHGFVSPDLAPASARPATSMALTTYLPTISHSRFTRSPARAL